MATDGRPVHFVNTQTKLLSCKLCVVTSLCNYYYYVCDVIVSVSAQNVTIQKFLICSNSFRPLIKKRLDSCHPHEHPECNYSSHGD